MPLGPYFSIAPWSPDRQHAQSVALILWSPHSPALSLKPSHRLQGKLTKNLKLRPEVLCLFAADGPGKTPGKEAPGMGGGGWAADISASARSDKDNEQARPGLTVNTTHTMPTVHQEPFQALPTHLILTQSHGANTVTSTAF